MKRHCMATRTAMILDVNNVQWVCDGKNAWIVDGVKNLTAEGLAALFDLDIKKLANMEIRNVDMSHDARYGVAPMPGEEEAEAIGAIAWDDQIFIAIGTRTGVMFVPRSPVKHIKEENRRFGVRRAANSWPIIACYGDMLASVLMAPVAQEHARTMRCMAGRMAAPAWEPEDAAAERSAAQAEETVEEMLRRMKGDGDEEN